MYNFCCRFQLLLFKIFDVSQTPEFSSFNYFMLSSGRYFLHTSECLHMSMFVVCYLIGNCGGFVCSLCCPATDGTVHRDDQVHVLQPAWVSASNMQPDDDWLWRATGRPTLSLLCAVDQQDWHGGDTDAGLLDQCWGLLWPADVCEERHVSHRGKLLLLRRWSVQCTGVWFADQDQQSGAWNSYTRWENAAHFIIGLSYILNCVTAPPPEKNDP